MVSNDSTLKAPDSAGRVMKVDAEHFAVRFLVPTLTILMVVITHLGGTALLESLGIGVNSLCIVIPADVVVLVAAGYGIERLLKRTLPSRRSARLSDEYLILSDRRRNLSRITHIVWDKKVNVKAWRFVIRRRTRVPKGWFCMAVQLLQDEEEIILYAFMSPQEAETLPGYRNFAHLRPRREIETSRDLRAAAEQSRLLKLENDRWNDGAELNKDDFRELLATLQRRVDGWA